MNDSAPRRVRVRAPELIGKGGWLNTGGRPYGLADLRGRIVILDFWTFCCINCLHVLDELRELEEKHQDTVVVIGVHSPKFVHEAEHQAVVDAVERYGVEHPVLDDPELATWKQYAVRAWPTLVVIDPEGYVVAQHAGEGHVHAIERLVGELEAEHEAKGTLRRGDGPYVAPEPEPTVLRFPGKALLLPSGNLLVSDTTRHQLVELEPDGETVVRRIGQGSRGATDGSPDRARFQEPQGLALLPDGTVAVADTVNHLIRRFHPGTGRTTTVAGTGLQWMQGEATSGSGRDVKLSSPWDVAWWNDRLWIAMAGVHQLWAYDPADDTVSITAGTTNEGLVDGPAAEAWFAQPSGLAVSPDGEHLWLADSETSALRRVDRDGTVHTAVGTGLFDFGHRDGAAEQALLQHPLGVTALPDGSVAVSDTYNHALRRYDPATGEVTTLATDLREPSDAVLVGDDIVVVESARHRLTRLRLPEEAVRVAAVAHRTRRAATEVAPGRIQLDVIFEAPPGQKLDTRYGPSTRLLVSATPPELLLAGAGADAELARTLELDPAVPEGVLHVSAMAASCDDDPLNEYPACHVHQQDWGVPVRLTGTGTDRLPLVLAGMDSGTEAQTP
ncbi:alkyl hydroperoxide reductase / thiol specific antioxidant / Mal allergen [Streptomyces viridochromogenes]|uniref:Alkyl hydroperoxide reductase / thiol specific antioxidant / Mal allergen n=1 Tax=Streptomyces viridochromogenes TaxID=1938 RepID=A0A0J8C9M4_STRVR|nr:NHL domain-containing thioredoxin family protein [Streptomyces viridochromogenes]KMS74565.1 alkyl hydroperoxide reductase / thiol specific antioxidant / Mal allergen [Streptomyces viridochromogenes]KOG21193.1 alkyl hydroperoxide reductase / thiol specific antioxidant / Mal allergen [Streptomyces viridochromogenes]KOG22880.1 alkyl hydroperoxide reductase / thiol specific antioxidant / Mal allergen [Streptomyces viridochromogenes]